MPALGIDYFGLRRYVVDGVDHETVVSSFMSRFDCGEHVCDA